MPTRAAPTREREWARRVVKREMRKEVAASLWKQPGFRTRVGVGHIAARRLEEPATVEMS